jgi:hypothetical protein
VKYNLLAEEYIKSLSSLQKVRIKVDPRALTKALTKEADIQDLPAYEGFILEEGSTHVKILVLPPDMHVSEIPKELIEYIADDQREDILCDLKTYIITALNLVDGDPVRDQIINSLEINEIESIIKKSGMTDEFISDLYKEFILS